MSAALSLALSLFVLPWTGASAQGAATPLWSGRFDVAPDKALLAWGSSFSFDKRMFEDDVTGSLAWAEALTRAGVLNAAESTAIRDGLTAILTRGRTDPTFLSGADEDVHSFVERVLIERIGDPGRRLHTGRSRNDQVGVDLRLYVRRRIPDVQRSLLAVIDALVAQADAAGDAVMPSYTHVRRAQPVLVSHYWLAHAQALRRDVQRFDAVRAEADAMPLGSGAIAGTNYAVDPAFLAQRLGFSRVVANSIDATSDRDYASSFLHASSLAMVHLSRLAEDVVLFTGEEFGFFGLSDAVATGSSLMPQKKNPDPMELVRGKTGRTIGHLTALLTTMKGLPTGYNKDLQEDKESLFDAEDTVMGSAGAAATVVRTLTLDRARTARAASGFLLATDVADYLVAKGVAFRTAHEVVGGMVRDLLKQQRTFEALTPAEWRMFHPQFGADVMRVVTAQSSVRAKRTPQSTHPDAVQAQLTEMRAWLDSQHAAMPLPVRDLDVRGSGAPVFRIPALAVTTAGTLLAAYDARPAMADVPSNIALVLRRSADGGATWSERVVVRSDTAPYGFGDPSFVVDRVTGRVFLFHAASVAQGFMGSRTGHRDDDPQILHADVSWSDDDGATWRHRRLTSMIKDTTWGGLFATSGAGIQLQQGAHAGRLVQPYVIRMAGATYGASLLSDDHGATWRMGALVGPGVDENEVVELADGTVQLNARATPYRLVAASRDGGAHYGALRADSTLVDPANNAALIRTPGGALLFSNTADRTARQRLTVRKSCDGGATWPVSRVLEPGAAAYSTMAVLPDGDVGVLFERGAYAAISYVRLPASWVGRC
ncbi:MAG: argininosuccinate lyase [Gemmatimonadota bacterium]|nr:argininosuccinate lyase [Gemmatimonadota bacterium]